MAHHAIAGYSAYATSHTSCGFSHHYLHGRISLEPRWLVHIGNFIKWYFLLFKRTESLHYFLLYLFIKARTHLARIVQLAFSNTPTSNALNNLKYLH